MAFIFVTLSFDELKGRERLGDIDAAIYLIIQVT
jgi:hypothetical protein